MKGDGGGVCQHWEEKQLRLPHASMLDPDRAAPCHTRALPSQREGTRVGGEKERYPDEAGARIELRFESATR